ncbi:MAG: multicopper oxidase domain-containing protein, partial [Chloroflexi bacterium]|nr:multicopper oxidase domain-containing protein [Chloroflexota bacterium]
MTVEGNTRRRSHRAASAGLRPLAGLALGLILGACRAPSNLDVTETPPDPRATAAALGITIDTEQMTEFRCHAMGETIMGDCSDEDLLRLTAQVLARRERASATADAANAGAESDGDAAAEVDPGAGVDLSKAPGIDPDLLAELADEGITVDLGAMADLPCHAMFDIVMGDCSEADVRQVAADLRTQRGDARSGERESEAGFVPGQGLVDPDRSARRPSEALDLQDGARIEMDARPVRWQVGDTTLSGYGYNGMIPGPLLRVQEGDRITVHFRNAIDMPTTIHWHGLRHDNADDGVPGVTQPAVMPGGEHTYTLRFPDPGVFWYHPHVREDIQQDAGLYGV